MIVSTSSASMSDTIIVVAPRSASIVSSVSVNGSIASLRRGPGDRPALERGQRRVDNRRDADLIPAAAGDDVVWPAGEAVPDVSHDPRPNVRGREALEERVRPSVVDPRRDELGEQAAARRVGVGVLVDTHALGSRRIEDRERLAASAVVAPTRRLQV